ncbi:MAG TPA: M20/M25/M40 family metallo-hydrolase, partial [Thermoguttaceae bacterium]|nr:M20/M25/M40 family metallo-hydrolase [Thermoguttaceae bacterium]
MKKTKTTRPTISDAASTARPIEPDLRRAEKILLELLSIAGPSGEEKAVAEYVTNRLVAAGVPRSAVKADQAHRHTPKPGQVGNLVCRLSGEGPAAVRGLGRRMFSAHMDTVPLAVGVKPVARGNLLMPAQKDKALGGDDRGGVAIVLATALEVVERRLPHPPLTFLWTVQEEVGLQGIKQANFSLLGKPRMGANFDGGEFEHLTIGATGAYRLAIEVHGRASHAGMNPEKGVSAITITSLAVANLHRDGWLGLVRKGSKTGTSNVGIVQAGDATNVVTPHALVRAEARSHDPVFRKKIVAAIEKAFRDAAKTVRSDDGRCGRVEIDSQLDYESFRLAENEPAVAACEAAVRALGGEPVKKISSGGLDANILSAQGVPTVTLGAGQIGVHTTGEQLDLTKFRQACRLALRLATATEGG